MAGLPDPFDALTPEGKRVYDKIAAKRGAIRGPFAALMHHPALAERVGDLGEFLRFGSTLPGDVREMAILIAAALGEPGLRVGRPRQDRAAGKASATTSSSGCGRAEIWPRCLRALARPARVMQHVLAFESIPRALQDEIVRELGVPGLIELVVIAGHYRLIAGVLFAFDTPLPEGERAPF